MAKNTKLIICDSTVNPSRGCLGCELWNEKKGSRLCYAGRIHTRYAGTKSYPRPFSELEPVPGRMKRAAAWPSLRGTDRPKKPWLDGLPRVIFIGDMADTFWMPYDYLASEVLQHVASKRGRRHLWLWYTKRPEILVDFARNVEWPGNLVAVTSVTGPATLHRIATLAKLPEAIPRAISFEPLLAPIRDSDFADLPRMWWRPVCWIVAGGASGPGAPASEPDWFRTIRDQATTLQIPFFFKQWGPAGASRVLDGVTWSGMPRIAVGD